MHLRDDENSCKKWSKYQLVYLPREVTIMTNCHIRTLPSKVARSLAILTEVISAVTRERKSISIDRKKALPESFLEMNFSLQPALWNYRGRKMYKRSDARHNNYLHIYRNYYYPSKAFCHCSIKVLSAWVKLFYKLFQLPMLAYNTQILLNVNVIG